MAVKRKIGTPGYSGKAVTFSTKFREKLRTFLAPFIPVDEREGFINDLEEAARDIHLNKARDDGEANKQEVNAALEQIQNASKKLKALLDTVDNTTGKILNNRTNDMRMIQKQISMPYEISRQLTTLAAICYPIDSVDKKRTARSMFALRMVALWSEYSEKKKLPTTTRNGTFDNLVNDVWEASTGHKDVDLNEEVRQAVKWFKKNRQTAT